MNMLAFLPPLGWMEILILLFVAMGMAVAVHAMVRAAMGHRGRSACTANWSMPAGCGVVLAMVCGAFIFLFAMSILTYFSVRVESQSIVRDGVTAAVPPMAAAPSAPAIRAAPHVATASSGWTAALELEAGYVADVYPSAEQAAAALGRLATKDERLAAWARTDAMPTTMLLISRAADDAVLAAFERSWNETVADGANPLHLKRSSDRAEPEGSTSAGRIVVEDLVETQTEAPWAESRLLRMGAGRNDGVSPVVQVGIAESRLLRMGAVRVTVKTKDTEDARAQRQTWSARYAEKPWVVDYSAFVAGQSGRAWVLGASPRLAASPAEAEQLALSAAAAQLRPKVEARLVERVGRQALPRAEDELVDLIRERLTESGAVTDRFIQSFDRPYGRVWRQAVLVDAGGPAVEALVAKSAQELAAQRRGERHTLISITALIGVILLTYLGLNVVTKGYFVWPLRVLAVGAIAGGVLLILALV